MKNMENNIKTPKLEDYTTEQQIQILQQLLIMQNESNLHLQEILKQQDQEILDLQTKIRVLSTRRARRKRGSIK